MLQKVADTVVLALKAEQLFPGASWVSLQVNLEAGWKSSGMDGVKWGSGWRKERLRRHCRGDVHAELPYVKETGFFLDRVEFRLSCVTSSTTSLSPTRKSSLRCQRSLKCSWDSNLWSVWTLGVGFEWQSRAGIGILGLLKRGTAQLGWSLPPARWLPCIIVVSWDGWSDLMARYCQEKLVLLPCLLWLCIPKLSPAWGLVLVQPLGGLVQHAQLWEKQPSKQGSKQAAVTRS